MKIWTKMSKNNFEFWHFLSETAEAVWGQKSFIWLIKHKFPLLRTTPSLMTNNSKAKSHQQFKTSSFALKHPVILLMLRITILSLLQMCFLPCRDQKYRKYHYFQSFMKIEATINYELEIRRSVSVRFEF